MFDIGGSFGIDLGAMGEGGGFFGNSIYDPGADAFRRANEGQLRLQGRSQQQSNANTLAFDRMSFMQKMQLAEQFGIHKLAMLGLPTSSGSSPSYVSSGQANFSASPSHSVKTDPQEAAILDNNVRISSANARQAEASATLAEMDVKARSAAALSTGRPPAARLSNDKVDSILKTVSVNGKPYQVANPAAIQEQYNQGEAFTAMVNAGIDPRLALSMSALSLMNPGTWLAPILTTGQLLGEVLPTELPILGKSLLAPRPKTYHIKKGGK